MGDVDQYQEKGPRPAMGKQPKAMRPLSAAEEEKVRLRMDMVSEHIPECIPEIKKLVEFGMIPGWRNMVRFENLVTGEVI